MGTRYKIGDHVNVESKTGERKGRVVDIEKPDSDSPSYIIEHDSGMEGRAKASMMKKVQNGQKVYYIEPYSFQDDTISREEAIKKFPSIKPIFEDLDEKRVSGGNPLSPLRETGYSAIAYTPPVKYAYYNEEKDILVTDTEGDIKVVENPTDDYLNETLSYYPKAEVTGTGEKYDNRFPNRN